MANVTPAEWISIVLSVAAAGFSLFSYWKTLAHDRKQATLEAYNRLQNEVFDQLNRYAPKEISEIAKNTKSEEYKKIGGYLARIEHFCVGVRQKIYDPKTVYLLAHGFMDGTQLRSRMEPMIERKQANAKEDYYANIHWLLDWMNTYYLKQKKRK